MTSSSSTDAPQQLQKQELEVQNSGKTMPMPESQERDRPVEETHDTVPEISGEQNQNAGDHNASIPNETNSDATSDSIPSDKTPFLFNLHASYLKNFLDDDTSTLDYFFTVHLRTGGAYWATTALDLLGKLGEMGKITRSNKLSTSRSDFLYLILR
jgi:hypothetical protein